MNEKSLANLRPFEAGNPGRPKGSRNKLGEAFVEALYADFEQHGVKTIAKVRATDPVAYVKVCASLLPKEIAIRDERELTDDELIIRLRQLDALIAPFLGLAGEGEAAGGASAPARH